jgi:acylphosphatase
VPELARAHVWVSGRVQGVFFRQETSGRARTLEVSGWVLNAPDGRVEAVFEGPEDAVEAMVRWCREGTEWSRVEGVEVEREEPEGLDGFEIRGGA